MTDQTKPPRTIEVDGFVVGENMIRNWLIELADLRERCDKLVSDRQDQEMRAERAEAERDAAYERCAKVCENEYLVDPCKIGGDVDYDQAVGHCAAAIRALAVRKP